MSNRTDRLRVAIVAGTLGRGGAEKQLVYQLEALHRLDVLVHVFCLTRGETFEPAVRALGVPLHHVGRTSLPATRMADTVYAISRFAPHVVQSAHFFTNLYAVVAARAAGAVEIGAVRSDVVLDLADGGRWGRWQVRSPRHLIVNSEAARQNLARLGVEEASMDVLGNVIDLHEFDRIARGCSPQSNPQSPMAMAVGRLLAVKRFDRYLTAMAQARHEIPALRGVIVGDGPERRPLEQHARTLGLRSGDVTFLGSRDDVPACLRAADMVVSCSDHEGFPNVVLEAMAASRPVVATPAGDCGAIVRDGDTGYIVPFDKPGIMAERIVRLARSPGLCQTLGRAGRQVVAQQHSPAALADQLRRIYRAAAARQRRRAALAAIDGCNGYLQIGAATPMSTSPGRVATR